MVKKRARGRSRKRASEGGKRRKETRFSIKGGHTALMIVLRRLRKIDTPKSEKLQKQIEKLMADTDCPKGMVIEL